MKSIKMFGLAALLALMGMAFVGASSASAEFTGFCSSEIGEGCEEVTHVHETTTTKAILLASPEVKCDVLFLGNVTAGAPAIIEGNFTYSNCGVGCSVTEEGGPSVIEVLRESHETAKVTGEGEVHVNCFGINCYYNGEELVGTAKGPLLSTAKNGEVNISGQEVKKVKGTFCPSTGKLDINTTPLEATYIVTGLHYCVDYGQVNGLFNDSACTEEATTQNKLYELIIAPGGGFIGKVYCVRKRTPNGLWNIYNAGICETMNMNNPINGPYEKGTVTVVK